MHNIHPDFRPASTDLALVDALSSADAQAPIRRADTDQTLVEDLGYQDPPRLVRRTSTDITLVTNDPTEVDDRKDVKELGLQIPSDKPPEDSEPSLCRNPTDLSVKSVVFGKGLKGRTIITHQRKVLGDEEPNALISKHSTSTNELSEAKLETGLKYAPVRRYFIRPLVGALTPLALAVYYFLTWRWYLNPSNGDGGLMFGVTGASAIYYSWFIIAALGLSASQYGLEGVEASTLIHTHHTSRGLVRIMTHSDRSWSRPDGWLRATWRMVLRRQICPASASSKLWTAMALLTLLGFVGLPLTGLTMNFANGYYPSEDNPTVTGFNRTTWNFRFDAPVWQRALISWSKNTNPAGPGLGVIYSRPGTYRSGFSFLANLPNALPTDSGTPEIFISPQADAPTDGEAWGLALSYNCSVVKKMSDFTMLRHRKETSGAPESSYRSYSVLNRTAQIEVWAGTNMSATSQFAANVQAVAEMAIQRDEDWTYLSSQICSTPRELSSQCYHPMPRRVFSNLTTPYPGLEKTQTLELVLWQHLENVDSRIVGTSGPVFGPATDSLVDLSLNDTIPDVRGAYSSQMTPSADTALMDAIGVRCESRSAVGIARVDGQSATFSGFQRANTPPPPFGIQCAERLLYGVAKLIFNGPLSNNFGCPSSTDSQSEWLKNLYASVGKPQITWSSQGGESGGPSMRIQTSYLQATELRSALVRAFSSYAHSLVYSDRPGYVDSVGNYVSSDFINTRATAYVQGTCCVFLGSSKPRG